MDNYLAGPEISQNKFHTSTLFATFTFTNTCISFSYSLKPASRDRLDDNNSRFFFSHFIYIENCNILLSYILVDPCRSLNN